MNNGEKFFCIKDYTDDTYHVQQHFSGKLYKLSQIDKNFKNGIIRVYMAGEIFFSPTEYGRWYKLSESDNSAIIPYFYDHFITLAEFREQQLNSILDD